MVFERQLIWLRVGVVIHPEPLAGEFGGGGFVVVVQ